MQNSANGPVSLFPSLGHLDENGKIYCPLELIKNYLLRRSCCSSENLFKLEKCNLI
jgi:hypothetical protein